MKFTQALPFTVCNDGVTRILLLLEIAVIVPLPVKLSNRTLTLADRLLAIERDVGLTEIEHGAGVGVGVGVGVAETAGSRNNPLKTAFMAPVVVRFNLTCPRIFQTTYCPL